MKEMLKAYIQLHIDAIRNNTAIFVAAIGSFLMPIKPLLMSVILFILIDTITGLIKACKLKEKISSRKLGDVVGKCILYISSIILVYIFEEFLLESFVGDGHPVTKITAIIWSLIEFGSIIENINSIYNINLYKIFKNLVTRTKEIKDDVESIIE